MDLRTELRKKLLKKTREQINEKFAGKEIHIIKAVNLLSDLESVANLLKENTSEWKARAPTGEAQDAFIKLENNSKNIEEEKKSLTEFVEKEMRIEFPSFSVLATPILGAKMLASAGSKKSLCFFPASTIQVLGAEKALFAHMRKGAKSPKHGHLFNHPLLQNLPRFKRGKAARLIAGKLAIALKVDYFNGKIDADEMKKELEEKIREIFEEKATPEEERRENEYDEINSQRRKQEFEKINKRREYTNFKEKNREEKRAGEHRTFTPEERRAYFAKKNQETASNTQRTAPKSTGGFEARRRDYSQERSAYSNRDSFGQRSRGDFARGRNNYPSQEREGYSQERGFGNRSSSFSERREGTSQGYGRTKNTSFGKGRFNKPRHSHKRF
jgi:hypothetical protein